MIVVETSTSISPLINRYMIFSSSVSFICPCAYATFASGTSSAIFVATSAISRTLLYTKYACPPRVSSLEIASRTSSSLYSITYVWMGTRSIGGSSSTLISRMPMRLMCSVRGIGVAVSVRTSMLVLSCLIFSLCATPKRCSSSIIKSPRSL